MKFNVYNVSIFILAVVVGLITTYLNLLGYPHLRYALMVGTFIICVYYLFSMVPCRKDNDFCDLKISLIENPGTKHIEIKWYDQKSNKYVVSKHNTPESMIERLEEILKNKGI